MSLLKAENFLWLVIEEEEAESYPWSTASQKMETLVLKPQGTEFF